MKTDACIQPNAHVSLSRAGEGVGVFKMISWEILPGKLNRLKERMREREKREKERERNRTMTDDIGNFIKMCFIWIIWCSFWISFSLDAKNYITKLVSCFLISNKFPLLRVNENSLRLINNIAIIIQQILILLIS